MHAFIPTGHFPWSYRGVYKPSSQHSANSLPAFCAAANIIKRGKNRLARITYADEPMQANISIDFVPAYKSWRHVRKQNQVFQFGKGGRWRSACLTRAPGGPYIGPNHHRLGRSTCLLKAMLSQVFGGEIDGGHFAASVYIREPMDEGAKDTMVKASRHLSMCIGSAQALWAPDTHDYFIIRFYIKARFVASTILYSRWFPWRPSKL